MISVISPYIFLLCMLPRFFFFAKLDMLITTIGIITIGTGMLDTTFEIKIVMIKKIQFSLKGPGTTPI